MSASVRSGEHSNEKVAEVNCTEYSRFDFEKHDCIHCFGLQRYPSIILVCVCVFACVYTCICGAPATNTRIAYAQNKQKPILRSLTRARAHTSR